MLFIPSSGFKLPPGSTSLQPKQPLSAFPVVWFCAGWIPSAFKDLKISLFYFQFRKIFSLDKESLKFFFVFVFLILSALERYILVFSLLDFFLIRSQPILVLFPVDNVPFPLVALKVFSLSLFFFSNLIVIYIPQ